VALTLAHHKDKLAQIRAKLVRQRETAPLFDTARYTRNLERSFEMMLDIAKSGETPRAFAVADQIAEQPV
jgi:predicted O-linked N-acetylglucosamine transferase (SPINDLY family)